MNSIYLFKHAAGSEISIGIGTGNSKRRVWLSEEQALALAYRLMSLASGGETQGSERLVL